MEGSISCVCSCTCTRHILDLTVRVQTNGGCTLATMAIQQTLHKYTYMYMYLSNHSDTLVGVKIDEEDKNIIMFLQI